MHKNMEWETLNKEWGKHHNDCIIDKEHDILPNSWIGVGFKRQKEEIEVQNGERN